MKRGVISLVVISAIFLFLISNASALFIGITDGYVTNNTGGIAPGATVTVTVTGCSGGSSNGCTGSATSSSTGYYIVNNLNLPKSGGVTVSAVKGAGIGSASGTADIYQVAHVNITICYAPSSPTLTPVADGDEPNVTFSWTPGTDPNAQPIQDDFRLNSILTSPATSPVLRTGLSFTTHTWNARTCNSMCCSDWASDTFTLTCPAPSAPSVVDVPNSHNTTVQFSWTSGTDPHGRPTWDKFDLDSSVTDPATSPITRIVGFAAHSWRVATCNTYCCSSWTTDTFTTGNAAPSEPTNANHTVDNTITSLTWVSGIDPEGDPTYDEFKYSNGTIVTLATSPFNVTTELLIKWSVRTCDNHNACSNWVSTDTITCGSNVTTSCSSCPTCEECSDKQTNKWYGGGVGCRKVAMTCNGIPIGDDVLLSLNLQLGPNGKKLTIQGLNTTLEDIEYCPWCYNGKKDYDESGVDCGGSCRNCSEAESPRKITDSPLVWLAALTLALALFYIGYKVYQRRKLFRYKKAKK